MRINYIHQYYNNLSMSGGTRSYEMARRLVSMGHEVNMITSAREPSKNKNNWYFTNEEGIHVYWLPVPYSNFMSFSQRINSFVNFGFRSASLSASLQADVVFATSTPLTVALPGAYSAWRQNIPMVFEVRDLWPDVPIAMGVLSSPFAKRAAKLLESYAYYNSSEIVALSPDMARGVANAGFDERRITMIPNGCDLNLFSPNVRLGIQFRCEHNIPSDRILFVYAGTFGLVNDVSYLAHLAKELISDTRYFFLGIGGGLDFDNVSRLAADLGVLGNNLMLLNSVPKSRMPSVLAAADIASSFVAPIPALEANSANKFFDGLAAGCCFAVNHGGWQAKLLEESGAGLVLSRSIPVAAAQLRELADNSVRLDSAKVAARALSESQFSFDSLASQLEEVLLRASAR